MKSQGYEIIQKKEDAIQILRQRRKNSGFFEEFSSADYKRECIEEKCNYEELSEIFATHIDKEYQINKHWNQLNKKCYTDPCHAKGTLKCIQSWNRRDCYCHEGYRGERCHLDIDECLASPCQDDEICLNTVGSYSCACQSGYAPDNFGNCQDVNECEIDFDICM